MGWFCRAWQARLRRSTRRRRPHCLPWRGRTARARRRLLLLGCALLSASKRGLARRRSARRLRRGWRRWARARRRGRLLSWLLKRRGGCRRRCGRRCAQLRRGRRSRRGGRWLIIIERDTLVICARTMGRGRRHITPLISNIPKVRRAFTSVNNRRSDEIEALQRRPRHVALIKHRMRRDNRLLGGRVVEQPGFGARRVPQEDALLRVRLERAPVLILHQDIGQAPKDAEVADIRRLAGPGDVGGGVCWSWCLRAL